jgi:hypothetical protein
VTRLSTSVRDGVRRRAGGRCEYCRKPEGFSAHAHHVDHVIAQKHGGGDQPENLAFACFQCNLNKGSDIAGFDPDTGRLTPLYHPRSQGWEDHFAFDGPTLVGRTPAARATIRLLQINDPDQVETRRLLMEAGLWV